MTAPIRLRGFPAPRRLALRWLIEARRTDTMVVDRPLRAGGSSLLGTASRALSGHRAVGGSLAAIDYPLVDVAAHGDLIFGVTTHAAGGGESVRVQTSGLLVEPTWSWAIGPVFAGEAGHLTQTPPLGAWLRQIGTAVAPDQIVISLRPTIQTI